MSCVKQYQFNGLHLNILQGNCYWVSHPLGVTHPVNFIYSQMQHLFVITASYQKFYNFTP
jgi:hypothetical protein